MYFTSPHQIIGMVVVAFLIAQFCLGFLHHVEFQKTNMPTKYGKIHLWLGRGVLFLGVVNLFLYGILFSRCITSSNITANSSAAAMPLP